MNDTNSFLIHNQRLIISNLILLLKNKCLIRAYFGGNNESYITTLIGINEENNSLYLDYGPKDYINIQVLHAKKITFETDYNGIKVSFTSADLKETTYKGDKLFSMPIPKTLFWMERREYYRVKIPISKPSFCKLTLDNGEFFNIKLHDLSLSGFSILDQYKESFSQLELGTTFKQSKIILFEEEEQLVTFELRYNFIINPDKRQKLQKNGFIFTKLTHSAEDSIQRYIQQIQREDLQDGTINQEKILINKKIIIYKPDR